MNPDSTFSTASVFSIWLALACFFLATPALCGDLDCVNKSLPKAVEGVSYHKQFPEPRLEAKGGIPPYAWKVVEGVLPRGMELKEDGLLYGTPEYGRDQPGVYNFFVEVSDAAGNSAQDVYRLKLWSSLSAKGAGQSNVPWYTWFLLMTPGPILIFFVLRYAKRRQARSQAAENAGSSTATASINID